MDLHDVTIRDEGPGRPKAFALTVDGRPVRHVTDYAVRGGPTGMTEVTVTFLARIRPAADPRPHPPTEG